MACLIGGAALTIAGIRKGRGGILHALAGTALMRRGATGHCEIYDYLGRSGNVTLPYERGIRARGSVTLNQPRQEVFRFWRQFENLPHFMRHLVSVQAIGENRWRWEAKGPMDRDVMWDAEIINEIPNELIAWRSLKGSDVDSAGSVRFKDAPGGRGTEIRVELQYDPPAGVLGAYVARLFGREPEQEIKSDLARLKQFLEAGEVATTEGQPHGEAAKPGKGAKAGRMYEEAIA